MFGSAAPGQMETRGLRKSVRISDTKPKGDLLPDNVGPNTVAKPPDEPAKVVKSEGIPDTATKSGSKPNTVTMSKDMVFGLVIALLVILLALSVLTSGFGLVKANCQVVQQNNTDGGANPPANASANGTTYMQLPQLLLEAPLMGSEDSAVTVVEFSDFQCPFCGMAWGSPWADEYAASYGPILGTVKKLETQYVATGKIAFRHFPVAFLGDESTYASNAALCAGAQGKYWEMHDAIFTAQTPEENSGKYSKENLKLIAQNISGLDMAAFGSCVDGDTYMDAVDGFTTDWNTVSYANSGKAGTPTFYVVLDASQVTEAEVSAAAEAAGYQWGATSDNKYYLVVADPEYAVLKGFIDSVAG